MKSLIYELSAPRLLVLKEGLVDESGLDAESVIAKTSFSAISTGTELAAWTGKPPLRPSTVYPRLVGYCNVSQVRAVGSSVDDLVAGDVILTHQSHRSAFCCGRKEVLLIAKDPSQISQKRLATAYLYHLGYSALLQGGYKPGFEVAVIGLGALGFACASLVSAYGGIPILFSGRSNPGALMEHIPFAQCVDKTRGEVFYPSTMGPGGADLVINTSDSWTDYELSLDTVRRGGTIVLLGFPGRGMTLPTFNPFDSKYLYDKAISIRQVGHVSAPDGGSADTRLTLERSLAHIYSLLESGRVDPAPLLKTVYAWNRLEEAYQFLEARPEDAVSAILDWSC